MKLYCAHCVYQNNPALLHSLSFPPLFSRSPDLTAVKSLLSLNFRRRLVTKNQNDINAPPVDDAYVGHPHSCAGNLIYLTIFYSATLRVFSPCSHVSSHYCEFSSSYEHTQTALLLSPTPTLVVHAPPSVHATYPLLSVAPGWYEG